MTNGQGLKAGAILSAFVCLTPSAAGRQAVRWPAVDACVIPQPTRTISIVDDKPRGVFLNTLVLATELSDGSTTDNSAFELQFAVAMDDR